MKFQLWWPQEIIMRPFDGAKEIIARGDTVIRSATFLIVVVMEGIVGKMTEEMTHLRQLPRVILHKWYTVKIRGDTDERTRRNELQRKF